MEKLLEIILSEQGVIAFLFFCTLIGFYFLAKWFGGNYLKLMEENQRLEREAQERKDMKFLKAIGEIVTIVVSGDERHKEAHEKIGQIILEGHTAIKAKLNDIHNKVNLLVKDK